MAHRVPRKLCQLLVYWVSFLDCCAASELGGGTCSNLFRNENDDAQLALRSALAHTLKIPFGINGQFCSCRQLEPFLLPWDLLGSHRNIKVLLILNILAVLKEQCYFHFNSYCCTCDIKCGWIPGGPCARINLQWEKEKCKINRKRKSRKKDHLSYQHHFSLPWQLCYLHGARVSTLLSSIVFRFSLKKCLRMPWFHTSCWCFGGWQTTPNQLQFFSYESRLVPQYSSNLQTLRSCCIYKETSTIKFGMQTVINPGNGSNMHERNIDNALL